jgi:hypothetical protein
MTLASSIALKALDEGGMDGLVKTDGAQRLTSLSLVAAIVEVANSMLFYLQSSAH